MDAGTDVGQFSSLGTFAALRGGTLASAEVDGLRGGRLGMAGLLGYRASSRSGEAAEDRRGSGAQAWKTILECDKLMATKAMRMFQSVVMGPESWGWGEWREAKAFWVQPHRSSPRFSHSPGLWRVSDEQNQDPSSCETYKRNRWACKCKANSVL